MNRTTSDGSLPIASRQLGAALYALRERTTLTPRTVAKEMRNTDATVRRWERGESAPKFSELQRFFDLYGVTDPDVQCLLVELHEQHGSQHWVSRFPLPDITVQLRSIEAGANAIDLYDPFVIPGPFQTEGYARAALLSDEPEATRAKIKQQLALRMARQEHIYNGIEPPAVRVVMTEQALRLGFGSAHDMHEQLRFLYGGPYRSKLRILPIGVSVGQVVRGSCTLYTFTPDKQAPGLYVEALGCNTYAEAPALVARARAAYERLWDTALSERESTQLILEVLKEM